MQAFSRWWALATLLSGATAYADDNDLRIEKLGNPAAEVTAGLPTGNSNFQAFARTFGAAITSTNLMPPETLGHSGFNLNLELSVINLPDDVLIPTEGDQPGSVLLPSLHVRKGLPFSLELGARVGWVEKSSIIAASGELKWAINEGFTYLPDIGVRGHVTRLMGVRDLGLTAAGLDIGVGKQFPVGGMVTFTPYGGLDLTFVGADSRNLDFNQDRSYDDSLGSDSRAALVDTATYKDVSLGDNLNQRIYGGVRFIGGVLQLGAEFSYTRLGSVKLDPTNDDSEGRGLPGVITFNTSFGLDF
ncbi:hypothetical protein POL68_15200 [Stigmatella sp. ncwal1]|uniref:Outer membrane beta-barrel porin/alpha-amylase n=1 Tax=Stigmatella ashevillensis TaxID=2995309 RepID=A0ABT5DAH6_9BACT|nr:hypothetical protein [Stigmatella ashevillena]MDC0709818.1 hypothetical protein [Stigmatella ashevillena]